MQSTKAFVTDGGLETDLLFHHGVDLPAFAAYPLLHNTAGRALLRDYYAGYVQIARSVGAGLLLETPTWRANPDWGAKLGDDAAALDAANRESVAFLSGVRDDLASDLSDVHVVGMVGPRGDGYVAGERIVPEVARTYHRPQLASFAAAGADFATAYTLTGPEEAIGIVLAAADVGLPVAVSFTVETDGRLPDGTSVRDAVEQVDSAAAPSYFGLNCAHPTHMAKSLGDRSTDDAWKSRIHLLRPNASALSHAELDGADELDEGDPDALAAHTRGLCRTLPALHILGGCCGTDARHVAALWSLMGDEVGAERSGRTQLSERPA